VPSAGTPPFPGAAKTVFAEDWFSGSIAKPNCVVNRNLNMTSMFWNSYKKKRSWCGLASIQKTSQALLSVYLDLVCGGALVLVLRNYLLQSYKSRTRMTLIVQHTARGKL